MDWVDPMANETYAQRLRVTFATGESVKYVGHLDLARAWERAIRRARLPLAYTQGFNPQPRLQFAAALPVGYTSQVELADIYLNEPLAPETAVARLAVALPEGIRPLAAVEVPREAPSLQSQLVAASYRVAVFSIPYSLRDRLSAFWGQASAPRQRRRGKEVVAYDLRPLVLELAYEGPCAAPWPGGDPGEAFTTTMRSEPAATGRPDELLAELGYGSAPRAIHRLALIFR
jgi:radical SAM-linked protein